MANISTKREVLSRERDRLRIFSVRQEGKASDQSVEEGEDIFQLQRDERGRKDDR